MEILFSGKRVDNSEWIIGAATYHSEGYQWILVDDNTSTETVGTGSYAVIPETVRQYINLNDKNGAKIFKGDILKLTQPKFDDEVLFALVEFGNPNGNYTWGWQLKPIGEFCGNTDILCWVNCEETGAFVEVIGNKWENAELLEEK